MVLISLKYPVIFNKKAFNLSYCPLITNLVSYIYLKHFGPPLLSLFSKIGRSNLFDIKFDT